MFPDQSIDASLDKLNFRIFVDALADATLLVDATGHVIAANLAAQELFKYSQQELCGMIVETLMPQRFREHHRQYRKMYLANPVKRSMGDGRELHLLNRLGEEVQVDIGLSPITVEKDVYILITLGHSGQKRYTEHLLQESEERLLLAKESAGLGIFAIDCDSGLVHCDEQFSRLWFNEINDNIPHTRFFSIIHINDRGLYQAAFDKAVDLNGDGKFHTEIRIQQSDKQAERWIVVLGRTQFEMGNAKRIVGIGRDITDRKNLEQLLQKQRNELETLFTRQVAVLTASAIAHEINSPLTAISAFSEVALRALDSSHFDCNRIKESLEGCVEQAHLASQSLYELIALLQGKEVETEALNLGEILKNTLYQVRNNGYGMFQVKLELEPDLPAVKGNRIQIQKVLLNLFKNAVEAMQVADIPVPKITIFIKAQVEESMALVTIQDNGPGIDRETIRKIFQPFFSTKRTGVGVGLAISRALIETNGGQLWIDPNFDQGARFLFTLPLHND